MQRPVQLALVLISVLTVVACSPSMRKPVDFSPPTDQEAAIERGRYLAWNVSGCVECHSPRDFSQPGGPVIEEHLLSGGFVFSEKETKIGKEPFPGTVAAPNITQDKKTGIGAWSDGEIARAIREGVNRDGKALFPIMPYPNYRHMTDEDVQAIIAYLRTIEPIEKETVERDLNFPLNLIVNSIPKPLDGPVALATTDSVRYGEYVVTIAGCTDCHTPTKRGEPLPGRYMSGGQYMSHAGHGPLLVSNITPDPEHGIGNVSKEQFFQMMREGKSKDSRDLHPMMPWFYVSGMTDEDLGAMYDYLMSIEPVALDAFETAEAAMKD